ncbi:mate efflux family protein alf5 [Phtheirospermum japonicum]|uniref:Mate efflux family protein alf5 n=1 Tax=Phtheirospermum japonicum TaxID=374723 RepID=A0A830D6R3_9LAMI|nr:mate efflux family protein alf5 [Phtheirospermum japonicum]
MDAGPTIEPLLEKRAQQGSASFCKDFGAESKTLWGISGPAIFTYICQYSLGALTQTFAGQVGELELAAVSVENSVIAGLVFGAMLGMGSALETLCGQAYGAGQIRMLGVYMQRSWVILLATSCILLPIYIFAPPILEFFGESAEISQAAEILAIAEQTNGDGLDIRVRANSAHIYQLLIYIFYTKSDGAWSGFSWLAFHDLYGFVKLSLASAIMLCLEFWYLMVIVVIAGHLDNPVVPVDAISICVVCMAVVLATKDIFPYLFTNSEAVAKETTRLSTLLALTVLLNGLQPVLSGVAVGAGWQSIVAYINIGCYYIVGLPLGILLGFVFDFGAMGIWGGMIGGICLQTLILIVITATRNWDKEVSQRSRKPCQKMGRRSCESLVIEKCTDNLASWRPLATAITAKSAMLGGHAVKHCLGCR